MFNMLLISRMILVLCASRVARFQPTLGTDLRERCRSEDHQNNILLKLVDTVDRLGAEMQQMRRESQQCSNGNSSLDEQAKAELQRIRESFEQLTQQLRNNESVEMTERQSTIRETTFGFPKDAKPGTPTIAHVLTGGSIVQGCALLGDELFVTRHGNAQVSVYDTTSFRLLRQLTFSGLSDNLHSLATCTMYNYLYIADHTNKCIHRVDLTIPGDYTLIKWNVASHPCAVSVNSARNVLAVYYDIQKVQEFTPTGALVRELYCNHPWQAVELSRGVLAVSQRGIGVSKVYVDMGVKHSYENQAGWGMGQMDPCCLAVDEHGYIIVTDYGNNRILVLNPSLSDARQLPLPVDTALRYPVSIVLDQSRGRLYLGEWGSPNRLLIFDNVTNVGALFTK